MRVLFTSFIDRSFTGATPRAGMVSVFCSGTCKGPKRGFGGTDFDGFAGWPGPRFGADKCMKDPAGFSGGPMLSYPYKIKATGVNISSTQLNPGPDIDSHGHAHPSIDAVGHTVAGQRIFDFNTDGLAQIGLLPDMIADWQAMGMTPAQLDPLFGSAEEYIRLWERAVYLSQTPAVQALQ